MVGPLTHKNKDGELKYRKGGFLRPGDKERDLFVTTYEIEVVIPMKVKPLYSALHDNLADEGWEDPQGGDKWESLYWERILENGMKEHHIWWRMVKYPHFRGGDKGFSRWAMKVDFQTLAVKPTEIAYKGKKKKVESADFIIRCWFWVQWDWEDKFRTSWVKSLQHKFRRQLYRHELDKEKDKLRAEAMKIQRYIKTYLDLEEVGEQPSLFEEHRGYQDQFNP